MASRLAMATVLIDMPRHSSGTLAAVRRAASFEVTRSERVERDASGRTAEHGRARQCDQIARDRRAILGHLLQEKAQPERDKNDAAYTTDDQARAPRRPHGWLRLGTSPINVSPEEGAKQEASSHKQ
jgi:hypothetical protein